MKDFGFSLGACLWGPLFFGAHKAYGFMILSFVLCFIPFFYLIWMIICGIYGAQWAYNSCNLTENQFRGSLETWNRAGMVYFILLFVIFFLGIVAAVAIPGYIAYTKSSSKNEQKAVEGFLNTPAIEIQVNEAFASDSELHPHFNHYLLS